MGASAEDLIPILWQRLGEGQSVGVLGGGAGDGRQLHAVCHGFVGWGGWWSCWRMVVVTVS